MEAKIEELSDLEIIKISLSNKSDKIAKNYFYNEVISMLNSTGYHKLLIDARELIVSSKYEFSDILEMAQYMKNPGLKENNS